MAWQRQRLQDSLNTDSKLSVASSPPARRLNRQERWNKRKKRQAGAEEKYYVPNWIAWNFLTHVWKNEISSIKAVLPVGKEAAHSLPAQGSQELATASLSGPSTEQAEKCMTSSEQLWEGRWPCIKPEVRGLGQRAAKTSICPSSLLNKSPNNHLPFLRA